MTASIAIHVIVVAAALVAAPSGTSLPGDAELLPVQLVSIVPARSRGRHETSSRRQKQSSERAKPAIFNKQRRSLASARSSIRSKALHVPRPHTKARPTVPVTPGTSETHNVVTSSSDSPNTSMHELDLVRQHLERFKFYPESARRRGIGGNVDVRFSLTRGGQAVHVSIVASSGHALLDRTAEDIVARAVPFPVNTGRYRVTLRFWP